MSDSTKILENWEALKTLVEELELDVHKNAHGNKSAGVRARKGLRALKSSAGDLVKLTLEAQKE
jgi:hypothetical protein|tara:strand:- start:1291 stop:1482 length:192 start_codon:yes stop_codon:yes gene_type:complete